VNWWPIVVVTGCVLAGYLASRAGWIDFSDKTKKSGSSGGGFLGVVDEVFAPSRHEAALERDRQTVMPAPAPVAGDGDKGIYSGRVTIAIDENSN
jgi:hypothetical protein